MPTGAINERGSNANGEFVKYADGTMFCYTPNQLNLSGGGTGRSATWTFPSSFISADSYACVFYLLEDSSGVAYFNSFVSDINQSNTSADASFYVTRGSSSTVSAIAIGRWY